MKSFVDSFNGAGLSSEDIKSFITTKIQADKDAKIKIEALKIHADKDAKIKIELAKINASNSLVIFFLYS